MRNFEQNSRDITGLLAETIFDDLYFSNLQGLRLRLKGARINPDVDYTVVTDSEGSIIADGTDKNLRKDEKLIDDFSKRALRAKGWISEPQKNLLRMGGPVLAPDGERRGYLEVGFRLQATQQIFNEEIRSGILVTGFSLLVGGILAVWFATNITRPIHSIVTASREIGQGNLETRLAIRRRDELGTLSESINEMATALQHGQAEIQTLREIEQAITSTLELQSILHVLLERLTGLIPASVATIWLVNSETRLPERIACWNVDEKEWKELTIYPTRPCLFRVYSWDERRFLSEIIQLEAHGFDSQLS